MALPIEITPELTGEDAVQFLFRMRDWERRTKPLRDVNVDMDAVHRAIREREAKRKSPQGQEHGPERF